MIPYMYLLCQALVNNYPPMWSGDTKGFMMYTSSRMYVGDGEEYRALLVGNWMYTHGEKLRGCGGYVYAQYSVYDQ